LLRSIRIAARYLSLSRAFFQSSKILINVKKATGVDNISPKLLHYAKPVRAKPISDLVNLSLSSATFIFVTVQGFFPVL
jgi:hypothetical protein